MPVLCLLFTLAVFLPSARGFEMIILTFCASTRLPSFRSPGRRRARGVSDATAKLSAAFRNFRCRFPELRNKLQQ